MSLSAGDVVTFDFGCTQLIRPQIGLRDAAAGDRLECYYDIAFGNRPTAMRGFGSDDEGFADSITAGDAAAGWQPLWPRGFRFLTIRLAGQGRARVEVAGQIQRYPFETIAPPALPDPQLQQVWATSCRTLQSAASDVFTDTCSRENVLWTFDACVAGEAACDSFGDAVLWRRCLDLIGQGIDHEGNPHSVVPSADSFMMLFDQAMLWVVSCRRYVQRTRDHELLRLVAEPALRFLRRCGAGITEDGLYAPPSYAWHWIDWAPIDKRAYSAPINFLLLWAAQSAGAMGEQMRHPQLQRGAAEIVERLSNNVMRFWDEAAECFANHCPASVSVADCRRWGETDQPLIHSLHANALALQTGVGSPQQRNAAADWMVRQLGRSAGPHNLFGPGWTDILLAPLVECGHRDAVLDFIRRTCGQILEAGAPTWPENFAPSIYNTAHGWGASVNSLLRRLFPS